MELTIEKALQQGVAAHKQGKLEDAERLYKAILQSEPAHADANHNLGVIAVSVNKAELALPLFKTSLEANPKIEQFWISYIDALIKANQLETANNILIEGRRFGLVGGKVDSLEAQLKQIVQSPLAKSLEKKKSFTLKEKRKNIAASKQQKKQEKGKNANSLSPSQEQLRSLLEHYQNGWYEGAEELAISMTQQYPKHQFSWKVLGAIFKQTARASEALDANQKAVELSPQDAEAHNNLGIMLQELGRLDDAEASYTKTIALKPDYAEAHNNLGNTLKELGRLDEAEASYTKAIALKPDLADSHYNFGITLEELGRLDEAEASYKQAIALKPDYAEAHNNLGGTLKELGGLDEAEASYRQAIALKPNLADAHYNLGVTLQKLRRLDEAEASYRQAIALKPGLADARNNLGGTLQELGRLDEAEASYRQAIALKPGLADAHNNLGATLYELGSLDEAEASYRQAIELKPDYAEAYSNLSVTQYINGDIDSALDNMKKAKSADAEFDTYELLYSVIQARNAREKTDVSTGNLSNRDCGLRLTNNPLIRSRLVERELITTLLKMNSRSLDKTKDARYGNGMCSSDFNLFEDDQSIIKSVAEDLMSIMMDSVKSDIFIADSFFNILSAGSGSNPHNHLKEIDGNYGLFLGKQKYSLVYYLAVGDQNCSEPGTLKLFDPNEDILPYEGMITIIPAGRKHSAVYGGKTDRIMIGVNFYSL